MKFSESNKTKAITFSYDDATTQDIRLINLLNQYNLKSTFNINSELLGQSGILTINKKPIAHYKVHAADVKRIYDGHEIAAHSLTHPKLTECDTDEIIRQVEQDRLNLSELAGYEVVGMAYPCGGVNNDDRVAAVIKEHTGIKYSRTTTPTYNFDIQENLFRFNTTLHHLEFDDMMRLGKEFIELKTDTPKIFYIWGHSFEMDLHPDNWTKLEEFFNLISNKDDIFYGTNAEVLL